MTKRNENRLTMYEGLITLLQSNGTKVQKIPGFALGVEDLIAHVQTIKAKSNEVVTVSAGKTDAKYNAADALIESAMPVVSGLHVFARKERNAELQALTNVTEYKLRRKRDTDLVQFCTALAEQARAHMAGLAPYGITTAVIDDLAIRTAGYNTAIGQRESSVAERKGVRGSMNELFDVVDEMLSEEFDRYMELLRPTETEFYNKYFAARVVKDSGIRHRAAGDVETPGDNGTQTPPPATA